MSRKDILKNLADFSFDGPALPEYDFRVKRPMDLPAKFTASATAAGSQIIAPSGLPQIIAQYENVLQFSQLSDHKGLNISEIKSPYDLPRIDLLVMDGVFGVAENGAIWVETTGLPFRVLPFIAEHLVIGIPSEQIVANMHDAYAKIKSGSYDFGVFIAGPSKTADIEQSLVIGAQGPRSLGMVIFE